jgi:ABC-type branched-subunit amino acid transport system ATPase component
MDTIRCEGLSKLYGGVRALADVELVLPSTGLIAIIGPNGAGKTTLLNVLTGLLRPDAGRCFVGIRETTHLPSYKIARLGIARTFQDLRLIRQISTVENVLLASPPRRGETLSGALLRFGVSTDEAQNRQVAERILDFVGLVKEASVLAGELSYGQQKLLALACCLATGANVLLLDEPIAGVHPETAQRILILLQRLRDKGKLITFIEHNIDAVRLIADHVIVMNQGKIVAQGAPQTILSRPELMEAYLG